MTDLLPLELLQECVVESHQRALAANRRVTKHDHSRPPLRQSSSHLRHVEDEQFLCVNILHRHELYVT